MQIVIVKGEKCMWSYSNACVGLFFSQFTGLYGNEQIGNLDVTKHLTYGQNC